MLIQTLGTNFSQILSETQTFSFRKMHLKMSSETWRPFCLGLNVLTPQPHLAKNRLLSPATYLNTSSTASQPCATNPVTWGGSGVRNRPGRYTINTANSSANTDVVPSPMMAQHSSGHGPSLPSKLGRLVHSPCLVAIWLSVENETWPPFNPVNSGTTVWRWFRCMYWGIL